MSDPDQPASEQTRPMYPPPGAAPASTARQDTTVSQPARSSAAGTPSRTAQTGLDGPHGEAPPRRRGRDVLLLLVGVVVGLAVALIVVALMTGDTRDSEAVMQTQIEALDAELAERDARIAELEARLAEAEAAAGAREDDIEAQRRALDERAAVLEEWSDSLAEREAVVAERERAISRFEELEVPGLDDEAVDNIVERILDQLRGWFR